MSVMRVPGLRNGVEAVNGMVYFGRMLDKIRLHAKGSLPADYNRGTGFDARCVKLLGITYEALVERTLQGGTDAEILEWAFQTGQRPSQDQLNMWYAWVAKRGWRDDQSERLAKMKAERGWAGRDEIQTMFDYHRADEESDS